MNHVFDRRGYREFLAASAALDESISRANEVSRRIEALHTREEWSAIERRYRAEYPHVFSE
jgi:hypothetical protein